MVINEDDTVYDYNHIKKISYTHLGIPSQCVVARHVRDPKVLYCQNLVLKMNANIGGINMKLSNEHFKKLGDLLMIIGATIVHGSSIDRMGKVHSIASLVGSLDKRGGHQVSCYRCQDSKLTRIY